VRARGLVVIATNELWMGHFELILSSDSKSTLLHTSPRCFALLDQLRTIFLEISFQWGIQTWRIFASDSNRDLRPFVSPVPRSWPRFVHVHKGSTSLRHGRVWSHCSKEAIKVLWHGWPLHHFSIWMASITMDAMLKLVMLNWITCRG